MNRAPLLLVRTDATPKIGIGHAMRCLAVSQAWRAAGGNVALVTRSPPASVRGRWRAERAQIIPLRASPGTRRDLLETAAHAVHLRADWIAVDGYHFDAAYMQGLRDLEARLLWIDEYGDGRPYDVDLLLNQNIYASKALYPSRTPGTRLLLGPRYALLRREFWRHIGMRRRTRERARRILLTFGGSDPARLAPRALKAIETLDRRRLAVDLVVGAYKKRVRPLKAPGVRLARSPHDMSALMRTADVAVAAAGSTSWELAFMGVPTLFIVAAENQRRIAEGLDQAGVARYLGLAVDVDADDISEGIGQLLASPVRRRTMSRRGQRLVDGQGAHRTVALMRKMLLAGRRAAP